MKEENLSQFNNDQIYFRKKYSVTKLGISELLIGSEPDN